jgi:hypothetical protein
MIALMFTTAAFAQDTSAALAKEKCLPNSQSLYHLRSSLEEVIALVELVPPDEADYIRKEEGNALKQADPLQQAGPSRSNGFNRLTALRKRTFYPAAKFHDSAGMVTKNLEAADRATEAKDLARHLIDALSGTFKLAETTNDFIEADGKRERPTLGQQDKNRMTLSTYFLNSFTASTLQCVVKGL